MLHVLFFSAPPTLQVSAGDNKVLTLPSNSIELYASAYPKETAGMYFWHKVTSFLIQAAMEDFDFDD